jgi:ADP-heptose:LPS heptosyltransferase
MTAKASSILFIAPTRIGDAVLSSGLVRRLSEEIPNARFTIVAGPLSAPLFSQVPNLDRLIVMEKEKGGGHWFKLWSQVRGRHWGLVLDRRGSGISGFLRARKRKVFRRTAGPPMHKVLESALLLRGVVSDEPPPSPFLYTDAETEARAQALLGLEEGAPAPPFLAVAPTANWVGKTWPAERFSQLAVRLMQDGAPFAGGKLLILGGPDDRRANEPLRRVLPRERWIDLTGQADLLTISAVLKHARLFVGNDSGLMHLAAAAGAPTLGLFGPSNDALYGPWGEATAVVRGSRGFDQIKAVDPHLNQPVCHMLDLSVDKVFGAAVELFDRTAPEPAPAPPEPPEPPPADPPVAEATPAEAPAPKPKRKRAPRARKEADV